MLPVTATWFQVDAATVECQVDAAEFLCQVEAAWSELVAVTVASDDDEHEGHGGEECDQRAGGGE